MIIKTKIMTKIKRKRKSDKWIKIIKLAERDREI